MKKYKFHEFDTKFLSKLAQDESSCVEVHKLQHHLALHPFHLNDLTISVKDILNKGVAKYNERFDGILFGYKNIKFLTGLGRICDDSCFIHVDIEADFFIFKPAVGKTLHGVVNKISKDHVGCLVHKIFNISLPKPKHADNWMGRSLTMNSEILLTITYTNFEGRLPYIRGDIVSILTKSEEETAKIEFPLNEEFLEETVDKTAKTKKKNSPKKTSFDNSYTDDSVPISDPEISTSPGKKKVKKSKKSPKKSKQEDDEISLPDLNLDELFSASKRNLTNNSFMEEGNGEDATRKRKHSSLYKMALQTKEIVLPSDSELDNLLESFNSEPVKKKKKSKRHKDLVKDGAAE